MRRAAGDSDDPPPSTALARVISTLPDRDPWYEEARRRGDQWAEHRIREMAKCAPGGRCSSGVGRLVASAAESYAAAAWARELGVRTQDPLWMGLSCRLISEARQSLLHASHLSWDEGSRAETAAVRRRDARAQGRPVSLIALQDDGRPARGQTITPAQQAARSENLALGRREQRKRARESPREPGEHERFARAVPNADYLGDTPPHGKAKSDTPSLSMPQEQPPPPMLDGGQSGRPDGGGSSGTQGGEGHS